MQRLTLIFDLPDELAAYLDGASVAAEKAGAIADTLLGDELPAFEPDRLVDLRQILAGIGVPLVKLPDARVDATLRYVDASLVPVESPVGHEPIESNEAEVLLRVALDETRDVAEIDRADWMLRALESRGYTVVGPPTTPEPDDEAPAPVLAPADARLVLADLRAAALLRHATYVDDRLREALDLLGAVALADRPSVDLLGRIRDFLARLRRQDHGTLRAAETRVERRLLAEVLLIAEEEWAGVESAPEVIAEARQYLDAVEAAGTVLP